MSEEAINQINERLDKIYQEIIDDLQQENKQLNKEYDKALEILVDFYPPCERDGFMDKNVEYCSMNCGVDEEVFKECWKRYIKQELEKGTNK